MSDNVIDAMVKQGTPALRNRDKEMIPRILLRAMLGLVIVTLMIVGYASYTGRELSGQPLSAPMTAERQIVIERGEQDAVRVTDPTGVVIVDLDQAGFISIVANGLDRARLRAGVTDNPAVTLTEYENGRLALHDPATGWSVELGSFGAGNKAAFAQLLNP